MRRMFRRDKRKAFASNIPPILQEANLAFDKGEYGRAAQLFERIAEGADARGGPRAPLFLLQAGRARLLAGQIALGMPSLKRALEVLAERKQYQRLQNAGLRLVAELNARGLKSEAVDIEILLKINLPSMPAPEANETLAQNSELPTHCPSCGAAVRPDEVEWLNDLTAECGYCGSPIR